MNHDDIHALESIDKLNFYNSYIFEKILKSVFFGKVLDFGCGFGTFIEYVKHNLNKEIIGYDINPKAIKELEKKNINYLKSLENSDQSFDSIVSMNTLEHIKDDQLVLNQFNKILKKGGILVLYLPQSMKVWTNLDHLVGHHRRYTKNDLHKKIKKSNFKILSTEYVDSTGWLVLFLSKFFKIDLKYDEKRLLIYDKYIFRYFKYFDILFKNFFGKNILVVARKL